MISTSRPSDARRLMRPPSARSQAVEGCRTPVASGGKGQVAESEAPLTNQSLHGSSRREDVEFRPRKVLCDLLNLTEDELYGFT